MKQTPSYLSGITTSGMSLLLILLSSTISSGPAYSQDTPQAQSRDGKLPGVKIWELPNAPDGIKPDQCWHAVGSSSCGDIYISGHDHVSNSMLYRLFQNDGVLRYVGDARTASISADNWLENETAQKFHTRPIEYDGKIYVATLDRSSIDHAYLQTRGFHWYAYDTLSGNFSDLSALESGGVGAEHMQVVSIQADSRTGVIYGATIPEAKLVAYDVKSEKTAMLGRPESWTVPLLYTNRFMWVDSRNRLYFTAGNTRNIWYRNEPEEVFSSVFYYDPSEGFEISGFKLSEPNAIECGQWNRNHSKCYVSDACGNLYCFTDSNASWEYIGKPDFPESWNIWMMQVSADESRMYIGRCDEKPVLYEFNLLTKQTSVLSTVAMLDDTAGQRSIITGYDSWDIKGNFYFSCFTSYDGNNVMLIGLNPVLLSAAISESDMNTITVSASPDKRAVLLTSGTTSSIPCEVLYETVFPDTGEHGHVKTYGIITIPAGSDSISIAYDSIAMQGHLNANTAVFRIIPDGADYVCNAPDSVTIDFTLDNPENSSRPAGFTGLSTGHGLARFRVKLETNTNVSVKLFDARGSQRGQVHKTSLPAGTHTITCKAGNASGVLIARLDAGRYSTSLKYPSSNLISKDR